MLAMATSWIASARVIADDIKIAHSVFALPFAVLAACMAAVPTTETTLDWRPFSGQLALVVAAMICARTVAMLANRLLDRRLDAVNPRTKNRAIPGGRLTVTAATAVLVASTICFMAVCAAFLVFFDNPWPLILGLPVLGWICAYPLFKRFTSLCHLFLGSSLALSPLAAALAISPDALVQQPALYLLSGMVMAWVAGFDVIYALQDVESDRDAGVFSLPSRIGTRRALWVSRFLHALAATCLILMTIFDPRLGAIFGITSGLVIVLLVFEHATVARWGTTRIALAFFTLNGIISCALGLAGVADTLWY